ncbi:MAG: hypothetical protein U9Q82_03875 [Chloroflexota bacterium]|nr:hypothetical protein [Chloroflexota bacterium]
MDQQAALDAQATQMAVNVQSTVNAQQATQAAQATSTPQPAPTQAVPTTAPPTQAPAPTQQSSGPEEDFDTWMRSASILLYEDMSADFSVYRFINLALEGMSLRYVDVRDAMGDYKNQLLTNGPGGQGWDLIISGKERRNNISGEFYVYLNDALNLGSSVIIEEWNIDDIASGKISTILSRCGVEFQRDWINEPLDRQLLYPLNGSHPIHHQPNGGISLTNPSNFWAWDQSDLGDLMELRPGSDAVPLWGARAISKTSYLTGVTCLDGQLTIQTYGSHSYGQNRIVMMWQNYIYNALMARYEYLSSH